MKKNIWNIIKYVIIVLGVIISGYLIKVIKDLDVLPNKYFIIMIIGLVICNAICILCITRKKLLPKILSIILYVVMFIVSFIGINYGKDTISFLDNSFDNNNVEITNYSIITLDSSDTEKKEDLKGKKVGYFVIDGQDSDYIEKIKKETDCELIEYKNSYELYEALLNKEIDAIVIDDAYLDILEEEYEDIDKKIKVIDTYEIEKKVDKDSKNKENSNSNSNKISNSNKSETSDDEKINWNKNPDSVNILISGIDSRSGKVLSKSRSDVNMIMTINMKTHTILLTSIPRDYYIDLCGIGQKDKLSHTGLYGIDMTACTLENVFGIKIDYSIKVGFKSLINIVDFLGGVDVYSDIEFDAITDDGGAVKTHIVKGNNHLSGGEALAFARERHALARGDFDRIVNQQKVLEAVINKIATNKNVVLKYNEFLTLFSDLYRTDIPSSYIRTIAKNQINNMRGWSIQKQTVSGSGARKEVYSIPGKTAYVAIPNSNSINNARSKIIKVYNAS